MADDDAVWMRRRVEYLAFIAICLAVVVLIEAGWFMFVVAPAAHFALADDFRVYRDNGVMFLESGRLYFPEQLAGPYVNVLGHSVLYPPNAMFLFVPLSLLPLPLAAVGWWGIPIALTGYVLWTLRPGPWTRIAMLVLMLWPHSIGIFLFGNSDMWMLTFVAAGIRWGWPAVFVVLKPTVAPLALVGVRRRSWWLATVLLALASLPLLPLWFQYVTAMRNLSSLGWDYSFGSIPLLLIPVVAWLGRDAANRPGSRTGAEAGSTPIADGHR